MYRVLLAGLKHEVNTFVPGTITMEDIQSRFPILEGQDVLGPAHGSGQEVDGAAEVAEAEGIELVPVVNCHLGAGPKVAGDVYEYIRERVLSATRQHRDDVDGVLLTLHGAMVTESSEDPEGDLIVAVREIIGPDKPLAVSFDMHCHFTAKKASAPDIIVGYHTHPHVDFADTGARAMRILARTLKGEVKPVVAYRKLRMIASAEKHNTSQQPAVEVMGRMIDMEKSEPVVLAATYFPSQPWMDLEELGWATVVTADGDRTLAQAKADELARMCWERRERYLVQKTAVREAIEKSLAGEGKPWVLSDSSDAVTGGGLGDGNGLLHELVAMGYADSALLTLTDPEAVAACFAAGVGGEVAMPVGGKLTTAFYGPVNVRGSVKTLTDGRYTGDLPVEARNIGRTAVLVVGGIHILLSEKGAPTIDASAYHMAGLEPRRFKIVQVKSPGGFRAIYGPFAAGIFELDVPGPCDSELPRLPFAKIPRPMWPFEPDLQNPW